MVVFMDRDFSTVFHFSTVVRDQFPPPAWAVSAPPAGFSLASILGMIARPRSA
jgi:hypothetical protein